MSDTPRPTEPETIECKVCLKEVPKSEAKISEVEDYVQHFCGLECYKKWQDQQPSDKD